MEILIALDLPEEIDKLVDQKRSLYWPKIINRLEPHLTIKEPSRVLTDFKIIEQKLADVCAKFDPIQIKVDGLDSFGKRVIFWKVLYNPELKNLNLAAEKELKGHLTDKGKSHQFTPHITILSRAKKTQFNEVMAALKKEKYRPKYKFICDKLMVLENIDEKPGWEKLKSFPLGEVKSFPLGKMGGN